MSTGSQLPDAPLELLPHTSPVCGAVSRTRCCLPGPRGCCSASRTFTIQIATTEVRQTLTGHVPLVLHVVVGSHPSQSAGRGG